MMPTMRCPDCGGWTTLRLCDDCAQVATLLGVTVEARLKMLKAGAADMRVKHPEYATLAARLVVTA